MYYAEQDVDDSPTGSEASAESNKTNETTQNNQCSHKSHNSHGKFPKTSQHTLSLGKITPSKAFTTHHPFLGSLTLPKTSQHTLSLRKITPSRVSRQELLCGFSSKSTGFPNRAAIFKTFSRVDSVARNSTRSMISLARNPVSV